MWFKLPSRKVVIFLLKCLYIIFKKEIQPTGKSKYLQFTKQTSKFIRKVIGTEINSAEILFERKRLPCKPKGICIFIFIS